MQTSGVAGVTASFDVEPSIVPSLDELTIDTTLDKDSIMFNKCMLRLCCGVLCGDMTCLIFGFIELLCNPDRSIVNSHNQKMDGAEIGAEETERSRGIQTDSPRQCFANQVWTEQDCAAVQQI